ncbi:MAG: hypothetical protein N2489_03610 [Clostridia bacterium]|nr:hypothetical protein [Clostridia bacterium]
MNVFVNNVKKVNTETFAEHLQNYIRDSMFSISLSNAEVLGKELSKLRMDNLSLNKLDEIVVFKIVSVLRKHISKLEQDLTKLIAQWFEIDEVEITKAGIPDKSFSYEINTGLIKEFALTRRYSQVMEKLIDKTIDISVPGLNRFPSAKKFILKTSPGELAMTWLGMDSSGHKSRQRSQLLNMLIGVNANIALRLENILIKHYTCTIYNLEQQLEHRQSLTKVI